MNKQDQRIKNIFESEVQFRLENWKDFGYDIKPNKKNIIDHVNADFDNVLKMYEESKFIIDSQ